MKRFLLAAAFGAVAAMPAMAADMRMPVKAAPAPVVAVYNWTGFYIGVSGGYGWGKSEHVFDPGAFSHGTLDPKGWLVGGTIGYNWQSGAWVFGVEGDGSAARIRASGTPAVAIACQAPLGCFTDLEALGTARFRLGYAVNNILFFGTAGAAIGRLEAGEPSFTPAGKETRVGWTAGGGIEVGFGSNWSAKAEYLRVDLGTADNIYGGSTAFPHHVDFKANIVRGGLNYRFGGPVVARY